MHSLINLLKDRSVAKLMGWVNGRNWTSTDLSSFKIVLIATWPLQKLQVLLFYTVVFFVHERYGFFDLYHLYFFLVQKPG